MNTYIDIEKALQLVNKRNTTVDQLCGFIYKDIQAYQDSREEFHVQEFKENCISSNTKHLDGKDEADGYAQCLLDKITKDTRAFSIKYASESIDCVLDAMNQKKFKTKQGPQNLLVLLSTLKEMSENQD